MRRFAFIIAILGLLAMAFLLNLPPKEIANPKELESLIENQKVSAEGKIISERVLYENTKLLILDNKMELVCECSETFKDQDIQVMGTIGEYEGKRQIIVLKISRKTEQDDI